MYVMPCKRRSDTVSSILLVQQLGLVALQFEDSDKMDMYVSLTTSNDYFIADFNALDN